MCSATSALRNNSPFQHCRCAQRSPSSRTRRFHQWIARKQSWQLSVLRRASTWRVRRLIERRAPRITFAPLLSCVFESRSTIQDSRHFHYFERLIRRGCKQVSVGKDCRYYMKLIAGQLLLQDWQSNLRLKSAGSSVLWRAVPISIYPQLGLYRNLRK
jgi:hypothetical protein